MHGWIKMYRKFLNWEWYDDINTKCLFLHLLLKANAEDREWHGIKINRGQLVTSLNLLSKETGLSIRSIRTSLDKLISTGELTSEATSRYRIITVCKYEDYQELKKASDKQRSSRAANKLTSEATIKRQAKMSKNQTDNANTANELTSKETSKATITAATTKECEEEKKKKDDKVFIPCSHKDSSETSSDVVSEVEMDFEKFLVFFNSELTKAGAVIPHIIKITSLRKQTVLARCREFGKSSTFTVVKNAARSDFLNGKNDRGFLASFDWIFKPRNYPKVLEGVYNTRQTNITQKSYDRNNNYRGIQQSTPETRRQGAEAIIARLAKENEADERKIRQRLEEFSGE